MLRELANKLPFPILPLIYVISGLGLSFLSLNIFFELSEDLMENEVFEFDQVIIQYVTDIRNDTLTEVMKVITFFGSKDILTLLLVGSLIWLIAKRKNYWGAIFYLIAVAGGGLLNLGLKHWFGRIRPEDSLIVEQGFSYPSGHAMGSLIYYGFLGYLVVRSRRGKPLKIILTIAFISTILLIGFSRVYLGVHYPSDIAAGFSAGTVWLLLCIAGRESIRAYQKRKLPFFRRKHPQ
ncbi:phosphatase PAP2 family protein [Fictibacillus sp. 18YEL24]|uniref:phosphatase PAP2 family protein n=1 Tax=Fictibacillus sp. 18YEL24 TaxID=2745875 RepID=UPI0018CDF35B|nr:phosphatase PAP2 family protein [Fictibacillus sp. 18YEL24]MBH0169767.1 phosphatase PAP2 family protein [Fictibacillus sp. 18YEL24]